MKKVVIYSLFPFLSDFSKLEKPFGFDGEGEGGEGGGDSDGGEGAGITVEDLQKQLNALKTTNENLKSEKKGLKEKVDSLGKVSQTFEKLGGEEGISKLVKYQESIEKDEMLRLLADGKHDEYIERRTEGLKKSHQNELSKREESIKALEERAVKSEKALELLRIDIDVREACRKCEGFEDSAIPDAIMLANSKFAYDPETQRPVMLDEDGGIIYGNDAKTPLSIAEWLLSLQEDKPHWWGETKGAHGKSGRGKKGSDLSLEEKLQQGLLTMDQYREERKKLGFKNY